jgi:predicted O-methyltransferase YrrM
MVAPFLLKSTAQQCEYLDLYREALSQAGHDPREFQVLGNYHLAVAENGRQLADVDRHIFRYLDFLKALDAGQKQHLDRRQYLAYATGEALWKDAQELRDNRAVVGTPEQCTDKIGELSQACGLTGWMFHINYGGVSHQRVIDQMHLLAEEVMPRFQETPRAREQEVSGRPQVLSSTRASEPEPCAEFEAAARARRITELAKSYTHSCVLFAANKLDVFTVIGSEGKTSAEVARLVGSDHRGMERLLDACVSLKLLTKQDAVYCLSDDSRELLDRAAPHYLGDWVAHWADMMVKGNWQKLAENVRAGRPLSDPREIFAFDQRRDSLHNWVLGMHQMGVAGHAEILSCVESLSGASKLLDVGGGPGTYSIFMCRRYPEMRATVLDSAEVSGVAKKIVREAGLDSRIDFRVGDFCREDLRETYDVILLSNVLHMCDEAGATAILDNAFRHLEPQGILLIQEWMLADDGASPTLSALFNLHMLINPNGDLYRWSQLRQMIERAGFDVSRTVETGGVYDVIVAKKPRRDQRPTVDTRNQRSRNETRAEVVVAGAGAAGMAVAIAAARAGAHVKLVEQAEGPGGTVANALIHTLGGIYDQQEAPLNGGLALELADRLFQASPLTRIRRIGKTQCLNVCPQIYRQVVQQWLSEETRIEQLYDSCIARVTVDGDQVVRCEAQSGDRTVSLQPTALVDATGTAEVVRLIDPSCVCDDDQRGAGGLIFRLRGVQPGTLSFPKGATLINKLRDAARESKLPASCEQAWLDQGAYKDEVFVKLFVPLPSDWRNPERWAELTRQALDIQRQVLALLRSWPEFRDSRLTETGSLGVRDGGRIRGEYYLTEHDVRGCRRFEDAACRCCWPIEYWHPSEGLQLEYLLAGGYYEIPLRALRVKGLANVWAAGKCLSADHKAQSSARIAGQCWSMGEAVGQVVAKLPAKSFTGI